MRNFILASAIAIAATLSTGVAARADNMSMHNMHGMHHKHCMMKTMKHRDSHCHWVMKKMRVCR